MSGEERLTAEEWHKKNGVDLFNHVWTLMEKEDRTTEEDDEMIHSAHASRHHWSHHGEPVHFARGEWQVSRMYTVLGRPEPAMHHARRCLVICEENDIGDFDLAFAHEAIARAAAIAGDAALRQRHIKLARKAGEAIAEDDDREVFEADMKTIPAV